MAFYAESGNLNAVFVSESRVCGAIGVRECQVVSECCGVISTFRVITIVRHSIFACTSSVGE